MLRLYIDGQMVKIEFFNQLDRISSSYKYLLISGDLNYNILEETYGSTHLKTIANDRALIILSTGASHHTLTSWIDLIIND